MSWMPFLSANQQGQCTDRNKTTDYNQENHLLVSSFLSQPLNSWMHGQCAIYTSCQKPVPWTTRTKNNTFIINTGISWIHTSIMLSSSTWTPLVVTLWMTGNVEPRLKSRTVICSRNLPVAVCRNISANSFCIRLITHLQQQNNHSFVSVVTWQHQPFANNNSCLQCEKTNSDP